MDIFEALEQGVTILVADHTVKNQKTNTCKHCQREIVSTEEGWADPLATGDDSVWSLSCDKNDTFTAEHDVEDPTQRELEQWRDVACKLYDELRVRGVSESVSRDGKDCILIFERLCEEHGL